MRTRRDRFGDRRGGHVAAVLGAAMLAAVLTAPQAAAEAEFCPAGSGAGQCAASSEVNSQRALAIDYESGRLYVGDRMNNRIDIFEVDEAEGEMDFLFAFGWGVDTGAPELQSCTAASGCQAGMAGTGAGQLDRPVALAVDNDPASASQGSVYVTDTSNRRVQKFDAAGNFIWAAGKDVDLTDGGDLCTAASGHTCGGGVASEEQGGFSTRTFVGVGPEGDVYTVDNLNLPGEVHKQRLQRFEEGGAPIPPQCTLFEVTGTQQATLRGIVVEADGELWVASQGNAVGLRKYDTACVHLDTADAGIESRFALSRAESGEIFAGQLEDRADSGKTPPFFVAIASYDAAGEVTRRFAYDDNPLSQIDGIAAYPSTLGEVFFSREGGGISYVFIPPPGPVVPAPSPEVPAAQISAAKATVAAEVNPEGEPTEVHFEFVTKADYEKDQGEGGDGFESPGTQSTADAPLGAEDFSLHTASTQIGCPDPLSEAGHPGETALEAGECLIPGTGYRWRIVATNVDGQGNSPVEGPAFTTRESPEIDTVYAGGVSADSARLSAELDPLGVPTTGYFEYVEEPDFEASGFDEAIQVPDVDGGAAPLDFGAGEGLATRSATLFALTPGTTYRYRILATNPLIAPEEAVSEPLVLRTFALPEAQPCANAEARTGAGALLPDCRAYELVSPVDKEGGDIRVLEDEFGQLTVLEQAAGSGGRLAYGSSRAFGDPASAPLTSQYIAQRIAGKEWASHAINTPRGLPVVGAGGQFNSEFKAFSDDLCRAWVETFAEMPGAPAGFVPGVRNLLVRHDRLCGAESYEALAPLQAPTGLPAGSTFQFELRGLSADGSHAILTANGDLAEGATSATQLYEAAGGDLEFACVLADESDFAGPCTAGTQVPGSGLPRLLSGAISDDGQRIFFSTGGAGRQPLQVRIGGTETRLVSAAPATFWGAATDGSAAVFTTGELNLGSATLHSFDVDTKAATQIATGVRGVMGIGENAERIYFASEDVLPGSGVNSEGAEAVAGEPNLYLHEAGAGSHFIATLAEADVTAAVSDDRYGKRNARVAPDGAHVAFVSRAALTEYDNRQAGSGTNCNPADPKPAQPCNEIYRYDALADELLCVSCNPTRGRPLGPARIPFYATPLHASRVLAEDGSRIYFQSADRLMARDSNGKVDVYQWEQEGTGGCGEESYDFSVDAGGCISLISSGQSEQDSRFVEADPDGSNVFFATGSGLLPQDPGVFDIYDARIGGGLPVPPVPKPPCEGDACARQIAAPEVESPASSGHEPAAVPPKAKARSCKRRAHGAKRGAKRAPARAAKKRCRKQSRHPRRAER